MFVRTKLMPVLMFTLTLGIAPLLQAEDNNAINANNANNAYQQRNLVSDGFVTADHNTDTDLVNPWGIAFNPNGFVWIANNHSGVSTLYDGNGVKQSLVVTVPPASNGPLAAPGAPTGIVFSSGSDFVVTNGTVSGPSRFIFATEDGTLSGWAPNVDATHAIRMVDNSRTGAIYKGLTLAANGKGHYLYATDFHNGKVDVFDASFKPATPSGAFNDPKLPNGYAPFGIQNLNGNLYVTYAKQGPGAVDDVAGPGFGFVNVFNADGQLIHRVASRGNLNAPWGLALAPADFGRFSNTLLVGNFGDGRINAYDLATGELRGQLRTPDGHLLTIEGLWGIAFGNGLLSQPINTLFFTAGPGDEEHGVYGRIDAVVRNNHASNDAMEGDSGNGMRSDSGDN
jgi:uncharacterized protein (TIGR03118 family)